MTTKHKATVIKSTGSWYHVRTGAGLTYACRLRGRFRGEVPRSTNPLAVGDEVNFHLESNHSTGIITHLHPRKNYLPRTSVKRSKEIHILASNIDIAFLVLTVRHPATSFVFIDRFLAASQAYSIPVVLVFNKMDVLDTTSRPLLKEYLRIYCSVGYDCLEVSALSKVGLSKLKTYMQGNVTLFSGHSGVGKSTLINTLVPDLALKTSPISTYHDQGQHTTTFAEMHPLSFGGYVVDTPGIRGFGLFSFHAKQIADGFKEFLALKNNCKFHNCTHIHEPQCAVLGALGAGKIAKSRYNSYLQMIQTAPQPFRT